MESRFLAASIAVGEATVPRLAACPLSGGLEIVLRRFLSIDTHGSSKLSNLGALSQQGCQLQRGCQRRNWRVRAVERGLRSEPAWLRAHPGLHYFEPEKPGCALNHAGSERR